MITISVACKHEMDRETIAAKLEKQNDFKIVSAGKDGYDALRSVLTLHPDIVILDFIFSDIASLDLIPVIKRHSPATALIVLYSPDEFSAVHKTLAAGVSGCFPKQGNYENLASSVRSVFYGGLYFNEQVKNRVLQNMEAGQCRCPYCLSRTEQCIFSGIIYGQSDREIAKNLNMSVGSLRNCVNHAKRISGLKNRTQLAVHAMLTGGLNMNQIREHLLK